jgi:serine/threonine-protein kinase
MEGENDQIVPYSWSIDESILVSNDRVNPFRFDIGSILMQGDHAYEPLLQEEYDERLPQISPDGRWMAYTSNVSGESEIYVRPFPGVGSDRFPVSTSGGFNPLWSPDGRELFYCRRDYTGLTGLTVMAVSVETEPTFKAGKPEPLFQAPPISFTIYDGHIWDIHPEGKRFLMMKSPPGTEDESTPGIPRKINIVLNWFEELKQRVPTDGEYPWAGNQKDIVPPILYRIIRSNPISITQQA